MNGRDNSEGDFLGTPGITIKGIGEIVEEKLKSLNEVSDKIKAEQETFNRSLAGHIRQAYQTNKNARRESDIEEEMVDSVFQVNMQYRKDFLEEITGSKIYMGITATKSRAARSWIKDLIQPANENPFMVTQSEVEELPPELHQLIEEAFEADRQRLSDEIDKEFQEAEKLSKGPQQNPQEQQAQQGGQPPEGAPPEMGGMPGPEGPPQQAGGPPQKQEQPQQQEQPPSMLIAARKLKREGELKRDIEAAVRAEIRKIANAEIKKVEKYVVDDLEAGNWQKALSDFIEDFTIFPTAYMKGPTITTKEKLTWVNGIAQPVRQICYLNQRISPFDAYPSPSAKTVQDGDFCEHIRLTRKDLSDLSFLGPETGFKKEFIIDILRNVKPGESSTSWIDTEIEEDKQEAEKRGSQHYASEGIYHGVHFWGTAPVSMLREWGYSEDELDGMPDYQEVEIEAMVINDQVIKCKINRDPLGRRPYYAASFQTRSGSIWGKSLPSLMRDIQRICNAAARSLADNMGLSSGPQVALLVDRLADDGDIEEMQPRMIWQFTSDPTGNGGKPIEFFIVPSNAQELLAVYDKFEIKADDVTGVPRYAYGNENVGGAGQTASGLSMLLESASKGIKASVKNISEGLIIPRVEYQFYLTLLKAMEDGNPINFSGDIEVKVHAVEAITIKAAQSQLQKEILQATANPMDMEILGMVGRGEILRSVYKGANLPEDAVPSALELKEKEAAKAFAGERQAAAAQEAEQAKSQVGLQATQMQVEGQMAMHQETQKVKVADIQQKAEAKQTDQQLKAVEIQQRAEAEANKGATKLASDREKIAAENERTDRKLAVDVHNTKKSGDIGAEG